MQEQSVAVGAKKIWPKALSLNIYCIDDEGGKGLDNTFDILNIILSSSKYFYLKNAILTKMRVLPFQTSYLGVCQRKSKSF